MKKAGVNELQKKEWQIKEKLVLKEGKVYVLKDKELRAEIIWLYHNTLVAKHGGKWKITNLVIRNYWWLGIMRDVGQYVERYYICQKIKNRIEMPV